MEQKQYEIILQVLADKISSLERKSELQDEKIEELEEKNRKSVEKIQPNPYNIEIVPLSGATGDTSEINIKTEITLI